MRELLPSLTHNSPQSQCTHPLRLPKKFLHSVPEPNFLPKPRNNTEIFSGKTNQLCNDPPSNADSHPRSSATTSTSPNISHPTSRISHYDMKIHWARESTQTQILHRHVLATRNLSLRRRSLGRVIVGPHEPQRLDTEHKIGRAHV